MLPAIGISCHIKIVIKAQRSASPCLVEQIETEFVDLCARNNVEADVASCIVANKFAVFLGCSDTLTPVLCANFGYWCEFEFYLALACHLCCGKRDIEYRIGVNIGTTVLHCICFVVVIPAVDVTGQIIFCFNLRRFRCCNNLNGACIDISCLSVFNGIDKYMCIKCAGNRAESERFRNHFLYRSAVSQTCKGSAYSCSFGIGYAVGR